LRFFYGRVKFCVYIILTQRLLLKRCRCGAWPPPLGRLSDGVTGDAASDGAATGELRARLKTTLAACGTMLLKPLFRGVSTRLFYILQRRFSAVYVCRHNASICASYLLMYFCWYTLTFCIFPLPKLDLRCCSGASIKRYLFTFVTRTRGAGSVFSAGCAPRTCTLLPPACCWHHSRLWALRPPSSLRADMRLNATRGGRRAVPVRLCRSRSSNRPGGRLYSLRVSVAAGDGRTTADISFDRRICGGGLFGLISP